MTRPLSALLQQHLVDWQRCPWPPDWAAIFGRRAALALEIGFGNGDFLVREALLHPERDHVGIELSWTAATHLFRRLERARATNVRVVLADAEVALRHLFASAALSEVFVNHPCPWPKARHHQRRLLQPAFLALLAERMRPEAKLTVVTDHAAFAAWLGEVLAAGTAFESCHATAEVASIPDRAPTKYERKALAQGIPIHYFEWRRTRASASPAPSARSELEMPSLTLRGPHDGERLFAGFEPRIFREQAAGVEVVVKLEALIRGAREGVWLLEVLVQEDKLRQEFGVLVVERPPDGLLIRLADMGRPHPTHGVRRALWFVARVLAERHPGLEIRQENLGRAALAEPLVP